MSTSTTAPSSTNVKRQTMQLAMVILLAGIAAGCALLASKDLFVGMLAVSSVAVLVVLLFRPTWATWMFLFLSYTNAPAVAVKFHNVPPFMAGAAILLLVVPIFYFVVVRREKIYLDDIVPWLVAYSVLQLISAITSEYKLQSFGVLMTFLLEGLMMYILTINAIRTRSVIWALLAAGFFMGSLELYQSLSGNYWRDFKGFAQVSEPELNDYGEIVSGRWPAGPVGDKNYFAQFMLMLFPLSLTEMFNRRSNLLRWAAFLAGGIILIGVGLTGSRGAAIGFVAMLALMIGFRYITIKQTALLGMGVLLLLMLMPATRERVLSIVSVVDVIRGEDVRDADPAIKGRLTEMVAAALVFLEHPIKGVGPGNFPTYFLQKADLLGFTVHAEERPAHDIYLEIAAETGLPGIICFLAILFLTLRKLLRAQKMAATKELRDLAVACMAVIVIMMTTSVFLSLAYARYYFLMIGLCSALGRIIMEESEAAPPPVLAAEAAA